MWEASVRATHLFLSGTEIRRIKEYVPEALAAVSHLVVAERDGTPVAFMGIERTTLEMLFIAPGEQGRGLGRKLIQWGIQTYGVNKLAVNEQNPQDFTDTWASAFTKERNLMSRAAHIPSCICDWPKCGGTAPKGRPAVCVNTLSGAGWAQAPACARW